MDLLIALKAGSRQLRRRPPSAVSYPMQPSACDAPTVARRLALSGAPEPYFVVNPHLFEDRELWPAESLRKLCSDLGLAASGTRSQLVDRLQDFDRNPTGSDLKDLESEEWGEHQESSNLSLVPICCDDIPPEFKTVLMNPPARRKRCTRSGRTCRHVEHCCSRECAPPKNSAKSNCSSNGALCFAQRAGNNVQLHGRGLKRCRAEIPGEPCPVTDLSRKRIKFSPFNNVQLITTGSNEFEGNTPGLVYAPSSWLTETMQQSGSHSSLKTRLLCRLCAAPSQSWLHGFLSRLFYREGPPDYQLDKQPPTS